MARIVVNGYIIGHQPERGYARVIERPGEHGVLDSATGCVEIQEPGSDRG